MAFDEQPRSAPSAVIEAEHVSKDFYLLESVRVWDLVRGTHDLASHRAIDKIDLTVPKGEIVGVLGDNGAGKSTLLRTLGSIYYPSDGHVSMRGDIASIFELGYSGNDFLTGRAYAVRAFQQLSGSGDTLKTFIADVQDFAELGEHFDKPVQTYSAGMRARLYFAVITGFRKSIFLIDEVLSVGDSYFRQRCWRRLRDFKRRGVSGVLATHDWTSVLKLCERCYVLDKGKVAQSGDSYQVVRRYLGYEPPAQRGDVWFAANMPTVFRGLQFEELKLDFPVHAEQPTSVNFGVSIEYTHRSVGWENVMLLDPRETSLVAGENIVSVRVPRLPLVPGTYMLHAFMLRRAPGTGAIVEVDARTWYHGNSLTLQVDGDEQEGIARFEPSIAVKRVAS